MRILLGIFITALGLGFVVAFSVLSYGRLTIEGKIDRGCLFQLILFVLSGLVSLFGIYLITL